ncbi:MAG: hypothetical protein QF662_09140, partial [Phycisphaerae bacterium]|nr:hypothetical protein [Phycisphaerae bacterium]
MVDGQRSKPPVGAQLVEIPHKVLEKELSVLAGLPAPPPKAIFQCRLRLVDLAKEFAPFTARGSARSPSDFFTLVETLVGRLARSATKSAKSKALLRIAVVDVSPANAKAAESGFAKPATNMLITACYLINKKAVKKGGLPVFARVPQKDVVAALKRAGLTSQEAGEQWAELRKYLKADYVLTGTVAVIPLVPGNNDEKKGAAE